HWPMRAGLRLGVARSGPIPAFPRHWQCRGNRSESDLLIALKCVSRAWHPAFASSFEVEQYLYRRTYKPWMRTWSAATSGEAVRASIISSFSGQSSPIFATGRRSAVFIFVPHQLILGQGYTVPAVITRLWPRLRIVDATVPKPGHNLLL